MNDDFFSVGLEILFKREPDNEEKRLRNLIAAIIYQAYFDEDLSFINEDNQYFAHYCMLLNYDFKQVAKKLRKSLKEKGLKNA